MSLPITSLLTAITREQWRDTLLALAATAGFPVTSWAVGRVARTLIEIVAGGLASLTTRLAQIAASGFLETAEGPWLTLFAASQYDVTRKPATFTTGYVTLTDSGGAGPYTITPGQCRVSTSGGLVFTNVDGGTLAENGTLELTFRAESSGESYNAPLGSLTTLLTDLPGVTVDNPEHGTTGTWLITAGADEESDSELRARCRDRWATLGAGGTAAAWRFWAMSAHEEVRRVRVRETGQGHISITVAGTGGPVSGTALTAVQTYLTDESRRPLCITPTAVNATVETVVVSNQVYVQAARREAVAAEIAANLTALGNAYEIGPIVYASDILEALAGPSGVRNVKLGTLADKTMPQNAIVQFDNQIELIAY